MDGQRPCNASTIGVEHSAGATGTLTVLGNSIAGSSDLGIDLNEDGVTANDAGDGDTGPNDLLNFPVLTDASEAGGTVTVTFDLDVPVNADGYRIEFFSIPSGGDPTGYGEGETYLGFTDVAGSVTGATFDSNIADVDLNGGDGGAIRTTTSVNTAGWAFPVR